MEIKYYKTKNVAYVGKGNKLYELSIGGKWFNDNNFELFLEPKSHSKELLTTYFGLEECSKEECLKMIRAKYEGYLKDLVREINKLDNRIKELGEFIEEEGG